VGRWRVSFSLDDGAPQFSEAEVADWLREMPDLLAKTLGTDLGVEVPVATSAGDLFDFTPEQKKSLTKAEKRKRRAQRAACKRQKGSKRRKKAQNAAARAARKQADIRRDFAHKKSREIVDRPDVLLIGLDGIKIANMVRSARGTKEKPGKNVRQKAGLNRSIHASAWGLVRQFTKYKALKEHKLAI
jgi:putative transposase